MNKQSIFENLGSILRPKDNTIPNNGYVEMPPFTGKRSDYELFEELELGKYYYYVLFHPEIETLSNGDHDFDVYILEIARCPIIGDSEPTVCKALHPVLFDIIKSKCWFHWDENMPHDWFEDVECINDKSEDND